MTGEIVSAKCQIVGGGITCSLKRVCVSPSSEGSWKLLPGLQLLFVGKVC